MACKAIKSKGTILQQEIASTYTPVANVISLTKDEDTDEVFDATTLDSPGSSKQQCPTGYVDIGNVSGELFYDPELVGHQAITDIHLDPTEVNWKVIFANSGASEYAFTSAGVGTGFNIDMADGVRMPFTLILADIGVWPTAPPGP